MRNKPIEYQEIDRLEQENKELRKGLENNFQKGRRIEIEAQARKIKELQAQLADDKDGCIENCVEMAELRKEIKRLQEERNHYYTIYQEQFYKVRVLEQANLSKTLSVEEMKKIIEEKKEFEIGLYKEKCIEALIVEEESGGTRITKGKLSGNWSLVKKFKCYCSVADIFPKLAQAIIDAINAKEE